MRRLLVVLIVAGLVVWRFHLWPHHAATEAPPPQHQSHPPPTTPPPVAVPVPRAAPSDAATPPIDARPGPITRLAIPGSDNVTNLLVVDGRLVWSDSGGSIWTMSTRGGAARELANQHDEPNFPMYGALTYHQGKVYAARTGVIATVALPDGPVTALSWPLANDDAYELVSDGTALYGAMFDGKAVVRFDDAGTPKRLAAMPEGVLVSAGSAVYSADFYAGVIAQVAPKRRTLARDVPHTTGFAADDHAIYAWSQLDNVLRTVDLASGKVRTLWKPDFSDSDALAPDDDWLYADATNDHGTSLVRIAKDGSQLQVLVEQMSHRGPIAIDADAVYASGDEAGFIRVDKTRIEPVRIVKPPPSK